MATSILTVLVLHIVQPQPGHVEEAYWPWPLGLMPYPVVAYLILVRRPGNVIGRTLGVVSLAAGAIFLSHWLAVRDLGSAWSLPANVLSSPAALVQFGGMVALLYLFPTGQPLGGWHRRALAGWCALIGLTALMAVFDPGPMEYTGRANPLGILPPWVSPLSDALGLALIPFAAGGIVSLTVRWRRSRGLERMQLRWFILAAVIMLLTLLTSFLFEEPAAGQATVTWRLVLEGALLAAGLFWALPIAIGIAVLRYRLYEIDRLISRTVTYVVVAGVVVGVYAAGVVAVQAVVPASGDLAVAASTLLVAAVFHPLRRRVHRLVDRRFNRARYRGEEILGAFAARMRDSTDVNLLAGQVVEVVDRTLQPSTAALWIPQR